MAQETLDLEYPKAPLKRRLLSLLVDFFLVVFSAFVFFSLTNLGMVKAPFYQANEAKRASIQNDSGLYAETGVVISDYVAKEDSPYSSYREKKDYLAPRLSAFYASKEFFSTSEALEGYDARRLASEEDGSALFSKTEDGAIEENAVQPEYLYRFYCDEIQNHALGYLFNSPAYLTTTKTIFWTALIEGVCSFSLAYVLFIVVLPLSWGRLGKKTIGRRIFKLSLLNSHALSVSGVAYGARCAFVFFGLCLLGAVSFLLPFFVSAGMLFWSSTSQDLTDYVVGQYWVDSSKKDVYRDLGDYLQKKDCKNSATIENSNFLIK
jgi:uncharacterized RDD family membrane protein YckC